MYRVGPERVGPHDSLIHVAPQMLHLLIIEIPQLQKQWCQSFLTYFTFCAVLFTIIAIKVTQSTFFTCSMPGSCWWHSALSACSSRLLSSLLFYTSLVFSVTSCNLKFSKLPKFLFFHAFNVLYLYVLFRKYAEYPITLGKHDMYIRKTQNHLDPYYLGSLGRYYHIEVDI